MKNYFSVITTENEELQETNIRALSDACYEAKIPKRFHNARLGAFETRLDDTVKEFALKKGNDGVFILSGQNGSGKTTLSVSAMIERGLNGLPLGMYLNARMIDEELRSKRSFYSSENEICFYERIAKAPFIVYDEAGKCDDANTEWRFLTKLLALRHDNMLPTFIVTNLDLGQFRDFILGDKNKGLDIYQRMKTNLTATYLNARNNRKEHVNESISK